MLTWSPGARAGAIAPPTRCGNADSWLSLPLCMPISRVNASLRDEPSMRRLLVIEGSGGAL
jgi:hypothetical protein